MRVDLGKNLSSKEPSSQMIIPRPMTTTFHTSASIVPRVLPLRQSLVGTLPKFTWAKARHTTRRWRSESRVRWSDSHSRLLRSFCLIWLICLKSKGLKPRARSRPKSWSSEKDSFPLRFLLRTWRLTGLRGSTLTLSILSCANPWSSARCSGVNLLSWSLSPRKVSESNYKARLFSLRDGIELSSLVHNIATNSFTARTKELGLQNLI